MRIKPHSSQFALLAVLLLLFGSCSTSEGIDDYFTFNLEKSSSFDFVSDSSGSGLSIHTMKITVDSADLASNGTSESLIKSIKLTRFQITSNASDFSAVI